MKYSNEFLCEMFNSVYEHTSPGYGKSGKRTPIVCDYISKRLPKGSSVLDASCGKGTIIRRLIDLGYKAEGTEMCDFLFKRDLVGLKVRKLFYSELGQVDSNSFDAVLSMDILEHLQSEGEIEDALLNLVRISKKYLLVAVGIGESRPVRLENKVPDNEIHFILRSKDWWREKISSHIRIKKEFQVKQSPMFLGQIK